MSTRSLMLGFAVAVGLFVHSSADLRADEKQEKAAKALASLGGKTTLDADGKIVEVDLRGSSVTDADLKALRDFENLQILCLGRTAVTDAAVKDLKELKHLQFLGLLGTNVSDSGVKELQGALGACQIISPTGTSRQAQIQGARVDPDAKVGPNQARQASTTLPSFADITKITPGVKDGVAIGAYEAAVAVELPTNPAPDAATKFAATARAYTNWGMIVGAVTSVPTPALDPATVKLTESQYKAAVAALTTHAGKRTEPGRNGRPATELPVLSIKEVDRVDSGAPPSRQNRSTATYILKTSPHATLGDEYVIVTDQTQAAFLEPLNRLAKFHHGSIIHVKELGSLRTDPAGRDQLAFYLRHAKPRFVAVAPKELTENMLLGFWYVLAMLGDDQRLPVCPGILAAPNAAAFEALIDHSINYHPQMKTELRPFVIGQVMNRTPNGQRSLQKVRMMNNLFAEYGCATQSLVTLAYSAVSSGVTVAPANNQWQVAMSGPGEFVKVFPAEARPALDAASLLLMFGHGSPGNACSMDVGAFNDVRMLGKVVMCGDCYSAASPAKAGKPASGAGRQAAHALPEGENFALRAVENGAVVFYAHMVENAGFPHLFPVLECWMDGLPVGEAYQRLLNALMGYEHLTVADLSSRSVMKLNSLLYVIVGDPALQPLEKMKPHAATIRGVRPPTSQPSMPTKKRMAAERLRELRDAEAATVSFSRSAAYRMAA